MQVQKKNCFDLNMNTDWQQQQQQQQHIGLLYGRPGQETSAIWTHGSK